MDAPNPLHTAVVSAMSAFHKAEDGVFDAQEKVQEKNEAAREALHRFLADAYVHGVERSGDRVAQKRACETHGGEKWDKGDECAACEAAEFLDGLAGIFKKNISLEGALDAVRALHALREDGNDEVYGIITQEGLSEELHWGRARWIEGEQPFSQEEEA